MKDERRAAVDAGDLPPCALNWRYEGEERNHGSWCMECWAVVGSIACRCLYRNQAESTEERG